MADRNLIKIFTIDDELEALAVVAFDERHELGRPPSLEIEVRLPVYNELEALIGHPAKLELRVGDATPHFFCGIVDEAEVLGTALGTEMANMYRFRVVPHVHFLDRQVDSRIYQDMDVQEICSAVFAEFGVDDVEWRLSGSYQKREYCVQYQESQLAFVTRLLEHEGIYFFVESTAAGDKLILADDSPSAAPIDDDPSLPVRGRDRLGGEQDYCLIPNDQARVRSGKFVLRDYNFENPALDLTSEVEADAFAELEVYDYPGEYKDPGEGSRLAQVRLEAEQAWRSIIEVQAVCPRVQAGRKLELADAGDVTGEYFVVKARHRYREGVDEAKRELGYRVETTLIPIDVPYRLPLRTPKPLIHGPQTARVVGPPGAEPETIHTDEHGRIKVKFHWDRAEPQDDRASFWIRTAQQQTSGSMILPRLDWEVIVEFLEGNPDQPVITGRVYNGTFMPPYALPDGKTRTALRSASSPGAGGTNEIRFEDKAGSEEIMIHAQHDMTLATANNKKKTVGNNETSVVGVNSSLEVGGNQDTKITKGNQNTIGADQKVTVGGDRKLEVNAVTGLTIHGSASTSVGGKQFEMIGNPLEALLALAAREVQKFLEAQADRAIAAIEAQVQGAVDQALGPIADLTAQAQALGDNMQAIHDGDMGAIGGLVGDASGIPGAGDFARSMGGGGDGGGGPAGGPLGDVVAGGNMITSMANNAVQQATQAATGAAHQAVAGGVNAAHRAVADALGVDAVGVDGQSLDNAAGPEGNVEGQDETDRAKGPGHQIGVIAGSHTEEVSGIKVNGVLDGINVNVGGDMKQDAGAAHIEVIVGNRAESGDGTKTEKALGLVVLSKGGEQETVKGPRTTMVGGAIVDKLKGSHQVTAGAPATFIGAFHKLEASEAITLKCGASEVVIDGSGITITSALTTILASKIHLPKKVTEI